MSQQLSVKKMEETRASSKTRVYDQVVLEVISLQMVIPMEFPKKKVKHTGVKKSRTSNQVSSFVY